MCYKHQKHKFSFFGYYGIKKNGLFCKNGFLLEKQQIRVVKSNISILTFKPFTYLSAPSIPQNTVLFVRNLSKVFTRSLFFQTIYIMKGNYTEKTFLFLIGHGFLYENYNSQYGNVFSK